MCPNSIDLMSSNQLSINKYNVQVCDIRELKAESASHQNTPLFIQEIFVENAVYTEINNADVVISSITERQNAGAKDTSIVKPTDFTFDFISSISGKYRTTTTTAIN